MEAARLLVKDAAGFSGVWRELHFEEWTNPGTAEQMQARFDARRPFIRELGTRKLITVSIVHDAAAKPLTSEARAAVENGVAEVEQCAKAAAVMIGASGFKAVIIRSIIAALTLMQGSKYPTKTFDDVDTMLAWVAPQLDAEGGRAPTLDELASAYHELRAAAART